MEGSDAAALVRKRNPGRVPIICELDAASSSVGGWVGRRAKFLVSDKLNVAQFRRFVRSNLVAESETCGTKPPKVSLFLPDGLELADDVLGIAELDDRHRSADGFLYLQYVTRRSGERVGSPRASCAEELEPAPSSAAADSTISAAADSTISGPAAGPSRPAPGVDSGAPQAASASAGDSASASSLRAAEAAAAGKAAGGAGEAASPSESSSSSSSSLSFPAAAMESAAAVTSSETAGTGSNEKEEARGAQVSAESATAPSAAPLPLPTPAPTTPPREQPATVLDVDDVFKSPIYTASPVLVSTKPATKSPVHGKDLAGSGAPKIDLDTEARGVATETAAPVSAVATAFGGPSSALTATTAARTLTISERRPSPEWPKPAIYHSSSVQRQHPPHALDSVLDNGGFDSMVLSDDSGGARESSSLSGWPALSRESTTEDGAFAVSRVISTTQLQSQWLDQPSPGRNVTLSPGAPALLGAMQVHAQRQQQQQQGGLKVGVILSQLTEQQQRLAHQHQHQFGVSSAPYAGTLPPIVASPTAPLGGRSVSAASAQSGAAAASAIASQLQQQQQQVKAAQQYAGLDEWVEVDDSAVPVTPGAGGSGTLEKGRAFLMRKISQLPETKRLLPSVAFGKEYVTNKAASLRSLAANMIASGGNNAEGNEASGAAGARRSDQFALGESGSDEDDDSGLALAHAPPPQVPGPQPPAFGASDEDDEEEWTALDCDAHDEPSRYV